MTALAPELRGDTARARLRSPRAENAGVHLGTINANVFQDDDYKLGSVTNPDPVGAYRRSGYQDKIARERVGGEQAGWGA